MGKGNYYPEGKDEGFADVVYVEIPYEEGDINLNYLHDEDFENIIKSNLPTSFYNINKHDPYHREEYILSESGYMQVSLADNEWSIALIFRYKPRINESPNWRGKAVARKLINLLIKNGYEVHCRCSMD
jgi:hypothetical protein